MPKLADQGVYLASESSFYRVLKDHERLTHRQSSKPVNLRRSFFSGTSESGGEETNESRLPAMVATPVALRVPSVATMPEIGSFLLLSEDGSCIVFINILLPALH